MQHRMLGRAGAPVSTYALGTMTFGGTTDEEGSRAQLDRYVAAGGTLIDTADVYNEGASEEVVGRWLAEREGARDRVVLATKGRFPTGTTPGDVGLSRRHLSIALDASLRRLGVDSVDLYQVHAHDPLTPIAETLRFLDDAVSAGKVHYIGLSNFTGWQVQEVVDLAERHGWAVPVTLQPQYNLLVREIEWEIIPACANTGLGLLPWSPLGGGWLTGKYSRDGSVGAGTRLSEDREGGAEAWTPRSSEERTWQVIEAVREVADDLGVAMAAVALAWLHERPHVTSVILGARTLDQLETALTAVDLRLDAAHLELLDRVSAPSPNDYPYGAFGVAQRDRTLAKSGGVS